MNLLRKFDSRTRQQLGASLPTVFLVAAISGAIGAALVVIINKPTAKTPAITEATALSAGTRAVLGNLEAPVEIRYYAMLDPKTVSSELKDLAARTDKMLSAYETEAAGKIAVQRFTSVSDIDAAHSASRDGIQPFNLESGEACFLGLAVAQEDRRESLPRLSSEWESAIEADLTRAISRVAAKPVEPAAMDSGIDPKVRAAAIETVQRRISQPAGMSLDDGRKLLREAAFEELKAMTRESQLQAERARQKLAAAQAGGSEADRQAALRELQTVQQAQADKLKELAARSQAEVEAWEQIKAKTP